MLAQCKDCGEMYPEEDMIGGFCQICYENYIDDDDDLEDDLKE